MQPFYGFTANLVLDMGDATEKIYTGFIGSQYIWFVVSAIMHLQYHPGNHCKKF